MPHLCIIFSLFLLVSLFYQTNFYLKKQNKSYVWMNKQLSWALLSCLLTGEAFGYPRSKEDEGLLGCGLSYPNPPPWVCETSSKLNFPFSFPLLFLAYVQSVKVTEGCQLEQLRKVLFLFIYLNDLGLFLWPGKFGRKAKRKNKGASKVAVCAACRRLVTFIWWFPIHVADSEWVKGNSDRNDTAVGWRLHCSCLYNRLLELAELLLALHLQPCTSLMLLWYSQCVVKMFSSCSSSPLISFVLIEIEISLDSFSSVLDIMSSTFWKNPSSPNMHLGDLFLGLFSDASCVVKSSSQGKEFCILCQC